MLTLAKVILSSSKGDFGRSEARFDELSMLQSWVAREAWLSVSYLLRLLVLTRNQRQEE
jgi:hypothetical protein